MKGDVMIAWLKQRLSAWVDRQYQREIDRLYAELVRLKAEVLRDNGGQPIQLSPEQYQRLNRLRQEIDPEALRRIDLLADAE